MTETAIVSEINGKIVTIGCSRKGACKSCSSSFCASDQHMFEASNSRDLDIQIGDTVDVYLAPGKTVAAGFLVLIVPLILFIVGYSVGGRLFASSSEAIQALFGLAGFGTGFGLSFLYSRKKKATSMPEIMRVREQTDAALTDGPPQDG